MDASKILIAAYSWSGQTRQVADQLAQLLPGAARYELTVADDTFPADMYATDAVATKQVESGNYPALTTPLPDLAGFDLILVGSPVWHGRPATPVHTFLQALDGFEGAVATFYTDAGDAGDYEKIFRDWTPAGVRLVKNHENGVGLADWLKTLNVKEAN